MTSNLYSRDLDSLTGAVYFVVGRGTEGGSASYQISVAGVSKNEWGQQSAVAQNSGYSLGAIQVDLGQRGTWPLGATEERSLRESEMTYAGAVIAESSAYAARQGLPYASDHGQLRADLLTHGNGQRGRTSITFINTDTRDSINAWAGSAEGQQWIHRNIDYAQVRNATQTAVNLLDKNPHNISDDRKFETICVLAKTANQFPGFLDDYEHVLRNGGNYDDIARKADELHVRNNVYAGNKARLVAEGYRSNYEESAKQAAMDNAHAKVSNPNFDPSTEAADLDIQMALSAIGQRPAIDPTVWRLQENLNALNVTDARGQKLVVDGDLGDANSRTQQAFTAFKQQHGLTEPMSNAELLMATHVALKVKQSLDFDRPIREGLPGPAPVPQMSNGMPDYLLSGRSAPSRNPVPPTEQAILAVPAVHTPPPLRSGPALAPQHHYTPPPSGEPVAPSSLPTTQTLKPGDRGAAVQALQQYLQLLGATDRYGQKIQDDRDYGERTREAVEQFQLWTGREPTGIADPDTLQAVQSQAQFALQQRTQGLAIASDAHLADRLRPIAPERVDAAIERPVQGRNQAGPAPHHDADPHPGARSAAMSAPSRSGPERKSEPESVQPQPYSPHDAQAFPSGHRDYALFEAIRQQLPDEYSDDMVAHATLEARKGGITRPDQIRGMAIENGQLTIMGKSGVDFAFIELTASAPPLQETLQQSAAFDQQQAIQLAQFQEQQRQINQNQSGPTMRL